MKLLITAILSLCCSFCFGQSKNKHSNDSITREASIKGYEDQGHNDIRDFILSNLDEEVYHHIGDNKIKGLMRVSIMIDTKGNVTNAKVINGLDGKLDIEVVRILKLSKWNPALVDGNPVAKSIILQFQF